MCLTLPLPLWVDDGAAAAPSASCPPSSPESTPPSTAAAPLSFPALAAAALPGEVEGPKAHQAFLLLLLMLWEPLLESTSRTHPLR